MTFPKRIAGRGGNPFLRPAFPVGGYRPADLSQAGAVQVYGQQAPRVGSVEAETGMQAPTPWAGPWRPSEAEIARWGGRVVFYGAGVPDHASSGTELLQLLDATMPVPMAFQVQIVAQTLVPAVGLVTPIDVEVRCGVGRAGWTQLITLQPDPSGFRAINQQISFRQIAVLAHFRTAPAAGEITAVSCGLGMVGGG